MPYHLLEQDAQPRGQTPGFDPGDPRQLMSGGDPPPHKPPVPPDPDDRNREEDGDEIPDTPGSEPPPVPIRDPRPDGAPTGPYIAS